MLKRTESFRKIRNLFLLWAAVLVSVTMGGSRAAGEEAALLEIETPHAMLMEASTGQVLYEKDADTPVHPASVTKVMTLRWPWRSISEEASRHLSRK